MKFTKSLVIALLICVCGSALGTPLEKDGPEYRQLEAMGYEVAPSTTGATWTVAKSERSNILINRNGNRFSLSRVFIRSKKDLNDSDKLKLFTIVNQINIDFRYQVVLNENNLVVSLYNVGQYDNKVFAQLVRQIEEANVIFGKYPDLPKLLK